MKWTVSKSGTSYEAAAVSYQLWYSLAIEKWIMVVKIFKHIIVKLEQYVQCFSVILNILMENFCINQKKING
jgi:hypothetical protein